ncbi:hypothetical protein AB833_23650 [Chromatiales bacterium (ex Bugula neritina AB1)]|nr:hypothetical protein AB833_23650 [Chromatiales bacterium (ex Bugula neritina AB1)]
MNLRNTLNACGVLAAVLFLTQRSQAADLAEIYKIASERDSVIQATQAQYDAAIEALPLARSALLPNLSLVADKAINETNNDSSGRQDSDSFGASLTQNIYNPTAYHSVKKAKLNVVQAKATLQEAKQNLMFRTAQAYFNILTAEEAFRAARSSREAISRQTEQAEKRFEVGLSAVTDVKEAQAQLDLAVAREVVAENQLDLAKEALRVIISQEVPELDILKADATLSKPMPAGIDEWIGLAERNSPRLQIARYDYELAQKDVIIERSGRKPTIALNGAYTNTNSESIRTPELESGQIRLQLTYPLYTGGRTSALIRQARARALQASHNHETVRRAVEQETRDAYLSVLADVSQATALRQALSSTEVAREATEAGFNAGTRTAVEVLVSLRDTFNAYADYAAARHQYVVRSLELRLAAGILAEKHIDAVNRSLTAR